MKKIDINKIDIPKSPIPFIWYIAKGLRFWVVSSFVISIIFNLLFGFGVPFATRNLVSVLENYSSLQNKSFVYKATFFLFSATVLGYMIAWIDVFIRRYTEPELETKANKTLFAYLQKHSISFFSDNLSGYISNKASDIVNSVRNIIREINDIISSLAIMIINIVVFCYLQPYLGILLLIYSAIHILIVSRDVSKWEGVHKKAAESRSKTSGFFVDSIANFTTVKLFAKSYSELKSVEKKTGVLKVKIRDCWDCANRTIIAIDIMNWLFYCTFLFLVAYYFMQDKISMGDVVYIIMAQRMIIWKLWQITWTLPNLSDLYGKMNKALETITKEKTVQDIDGAKNIKVKKGVFSIKDLGFKYKKEWILRNFNLNINSGEKLGIVGLSGSGKSTLAHLMLRLYDIQEGSINIDDQDISKVKQDSLRAQIAFVSQDNSLFHRTLKENIAYAKPNATQKEIERAAKMAHATEFIAKLEKGYQSKVGERGIKLSGGQRQRIAIARAFLKNSPILILDEATSSLDTKTEKIIQESLSKLMKNRTTIAIAHRLSTLREMDRIIVIDNGKIIEEGSHRHLLQQKGTYAKLWHMQSDGFIPDIEKKELKKSKK